MPYKKQRIKPKKQYNPYGPMGGGGSKAGSSVPKHVYEGKKTYTQKLAAIAAYTSKRPAFHSPLTGKAAVQAKKAKAEKYIRDIQKKFKKYKPKPIQIPKIKIDSKAKPLPTPKWYKDRRKPKGKIKYR